MKLDEGGQSGYRLGFGIAGPMKVEKLPFSKALSMSLQENKRYSLLIVELVQKMLRAQGLDQADGRADRHRARVG